MTKNRQKGPKIGKHGKTGMRPKIPNGVGGGKANPPQTIKKRPRANTEFFSLPLIGPDQTLIRI